MNEQRNLIIAAGLAILILFVSNFIFDSDPAVETEPKTTQAVAMTTPVGSEILQKTSSENKQKAPRVHIDTPSLKGSINLMGARFDDLVLSKYTETTDPNSAPIVLLEPKNGDTGYYASLGWVSEDNTVRVPNENSVWSLKNGNSTLTPQSPITLTWNNGEGVTFEQTIAVDINYMFHISQKVHNATNTPIALATSGKITRLGEPKTEGFYILHEGPLGVFDGKLYDPSYEDVASSKDIRNPQAPGWLGITDKYWLTALIPNPEKPMNSSFSAIGTKQGYSADFARELVTIEPGQSSEATNHFFAGAKVLDLLDGYSDTMGINHFDLAVDFGWFYFMTKPIFLALQVLKDWLGNFGLAILALTVILKILLFPLANKSYTSMGRMKALQPQVKAIQERYADDRMKMNEKMMELYKKEKVNPVGGCLPMLVQIPVFFALYKVLFVSIEMRHAPFYGWIHDLSAPDPTTAFNLFGLIPWDPPSFLMIGALPLLMGGTMLLQQKLSPPPSDPAQAKAMMLMPIFFTYLLAGFPAGLLIYWTWNNILSIIQQWIIMRKAEAAEAKKMAKRVFSKAKKTKS